jgi:hypothetical protein
MFSLQAHELKIRQLARVAEAGAALASRDGAVPSEGGEEAKQPALQMASVTSPSSQFASMTHSAGRMNVTISRASRALWDTMGRAATHARTRRPTIIRPSTFAPPKPRISQ